MPEQPHDMAEQSREAFIYIFGYRGLDLPLEKDMPAPEAPSLAELFDSWTRECWQVLPTSACSIVVSTLTASNRSSIRTIRGFESTISSCMPTTGITPSMASTRGRTNSVSTA